MSGYIGNDGSALVGGLNPSTVVQGIAVDAQGRLTTTNFIAGAAVTNANPYPSADTIRLLCQAGRGFRGTTGQVNAAANQAAQLFSTAASTRTLVIFSIRVSYNNANATAQVQVLTASDPLLTTAATTSNFMLGGGPASATTSCSSGVNATPTGTAFDFVDTPLNQVVEVLPQNTVIYVPAGVAGGVALYHATTAVGKWGASFSWIEM